MKGPVSAMHAATGPSHDGTMNRIADSGGVELRAISGRHQVGQPAQRVRIVGIVGDPGQAFDSAVSGARDRPVICAVGDEVLQRDAVDAPSRVELIGVLEMLERGRQIAPLDVVHREPSMHPARTRVGVLGREEDVAPRLPDQNPVERHRRVQQRDQDEHEWRGPDEPAPFEQVVQPDPAPKNNPTPGR